MAKTGGENSADMKAAIRTAYGYTEARVVQRLQYLFLRRRLFGGDVGHSSNSTAQHSVAQHSIAKHSTRFRVGWLGLVVQRLVSRLKSLKIEDLKVAQ